MRLPGRWYISENYRFGYQGQFAEKDPETGYTAFDLRLYDARIGRWMIPDPYGQYWSPYMAMGNNPVSRIDPNGGADIPPVYCYGKLPFKFKLMNFFGIVWNGIKTGAQYGTVATAGMLNAVGSNHLGGAGRRDPSEWGDPGLVRAASIGQTIGDAASLVMGAGEIVIGAGGEVLGVALDATGVGAVVGVPINVASAGVIAEGSLTTVVSAKQLFAKVKSNSDQVHGGKQKMGGGGNNRPGNNQAQNEQVRSLSKKYKLNKSQQRDFHDYIQGMDLDYQGLEMELQNFLGH